MEKQGFFSVTNEKVYVVIGFVVLRYLLGFLNHANFAAKMPYFVNMLIAAIDLVVSLPMKIIFATPVLKNLLISKIPLIFLFVVMLAYWFLFACILLYVYNTLNMQDSEELSKHEKSKEMHKEKEDDKESFEEHEEMQSRLF